jgi:hypothetical protein
MIRSTIERLFSRIRGIRGSRRGNLAIESRRRDTLGGARFRLRQYQSWAATAWRPPAATTFDRYGSLDFAPHPDVRLSPVAAVHPLAELNITLARYTLTRGWTRTLWVAVE